MFFIKNLSLRLVRYLRRSSRYITRAVHHVIGQGGNRALSEHDQREHERKPQRHTPLFLAVYIRSNNDLRTLDAAELASD
jgi:hypothetical protein